MKPIRGVKQEEVWNHWKKVEGFSRDDFRWDIRGELPNNIKWFLVEIEEKDIEKIFIISSMIGEVSPKHSDYLTQ